MDETRMDEATVISGDHIGIYDAKIDKERVEARRTLGWTLAIIAAVFLLAAAVTAFFVTILAYAFLMLAFLCAAVSAMVLVKARALLPIEVPANTLVRYKGKWYDRGPIWVRAFDIDTSFRPKMVHTDARRATWRTRSLKTPDGHTITYDVDVTLQLNPAMVDEFVFGTRPYAEDLLFKNKIQQAIKREVASTGFAHQVDAYVPEAKRPPYMDKLCQIALEESNEFAAEKGIVIRAIDIHNPQVNEDNTRETETVLAEIVPAGEIEMSDDGLLTTLKRDYGIVLPELFDPVAIKQSLEFLRNRQQPGLVRRCIDFLAGRVPQTEIGLLKAWEQYYTQVGATLEANHAARKELERAEVKHRLFLEESMAKVHTYRATSAEAEARIAEAQVRQVRAAKEITNTVRQMLSPSDNTSQPQKTFAERIHEAEEAMEREIVELDTIKDQILRERSQEEVRQKWAQRINRIRND